MLPFSIFSFIRWPGPLHGQKLKLAHGSIAALAEMVLPMPPYFFAVERSTSVQLSISPTTPGEEALCVNVGTDLSLKVEGAVRPGANRRRQRAVDRVGLQIQTNIMT